MAARQRKFTAAETARLLEAWETDGEEFASDEDPIGSDEEDVDSSQSSEVDSDSDDSDDASTNIGRDGTRWCIQPPRPSAYRQRNIVRIPSGPTVATRSIDDATEIFKYICDETIVRTIVEFTNTRLDHEHLDPDFSIDEFYAYVGILTLLGVLKKRSVDITEIWSEKSIHYIDAVAATMTRERFKLLSTFINF